MYLLHNVVLESTLKHQIEIDFFAIIFSHPNCFATLALGVIGNQVRRSLLRSQIPCSGLDFTLV